MAGKKLFQRTQTLLQQKQKLSTPEGNSEDLIDCYLMTFFYLFIYLFIYFDFRLCGGADNLIWVLPMEI